MLSGFPLTRNAREMSEMQQETEDLRATLDEVRADLRRKKIECEELTDTNASLQRKLSKLQPSLDSYEEVGYELRS